MPKLLKRLALCLLTALPILPERAEAFGGGPDIDFYAPLIGHGCNFTIYHGESIAEALVELDIGAAAGNPVPGGMYWSFGSLLSVMSDVNPAHVAAACGISDITNFVSDGPTGTYQSDAFMGLTFRGRSNANNQTYDYTIGLSGATNTVLVNSRVLVPNTPPTANAGSNQTVASTATVMLNGGASSDPDAGTVLTLAWTQSSGPVVMLNSTTVANPFFSAPIVAAGGTATLIFSLTVSDGQASSTADTVTITVNGPANTPPTADAGPYQSVDAGVAVSLTGAASSDPNAGQVLTYAWVQTVGPTVTLTGANTASPGFTAPNVAPESAAMLIFQLTVGDGISTDTDTVTIMVDGPVNTAPSADAGPDDSVSSGQGYTLDGSGSTDPDFGQVLTYAWTQTSGAPVTFTGATTAGLTFATPILALGDADVTLEFSLVVADGLAASAADTVTITVTAPPNALPSANAGPNQTVVAATSVVLDGSGSFDTDAGQTLTYAWTQSSGPAVTLSDSTSATPGFTAPGMAIGAPDMHLTFALQAYDGLNLSTPDTVTITVTAPPNTPPVANAGPNQAVLSGAVVNLTGLGSSDPDPSQTLTFLWMQTSGPAVTLLGNDTAAPVFAAPTLATGAPGVQLTFELQVSDGFTHATPDTVVVTVLPAANNPPVADAGSDQPVLTGTTVTLDGSGSSDPDAASVLFYNWVQSSGPAVTLTGSTTTGPSFTAPFADIGDSLTLTFELTVSDTLAAVADSVTITVNGPPNTPPTANAGADFTVASGAAGSLDGTGSNPNDAGQTLVYSWVQTSGPTFTLSDANAASPTFTAPYIPPAPTSTLATFDLVVFDGFVLSAVDSVSVTITPPANTAATADAGPDQTVASGATVTVDGSASDANDPGQALTHSWAQTAGTSVTLDDLNSAAPAFTAPTLNVGDADLTLTFELIVHDGVGNSTADTVNITVTAPTNTAPTANAGADQTVANGASVTLGGSGSSDPEGNPLSYAWTQTSGPTVTLTGTTTAAPGFAAPTLVLGDADALLTFQLVVNDGFVDSAADTVSITVTAPGSGQAPSVTVSGPGTYTDGVGFDVTITFSEPVTGLVAGDLQLANASVTGLTGSGASYVATLNPTAYPAVITVTVPAVVAVDIEALDNTASDTASIAAATAEEASAEIAEALTQRARALINAQPKLRRFLLPGGSNSFVASVTQNRSTFGLSLGQDSPVWIALQGDWSKTGDDEQNYVNLAFGGHFWRSENVIIGAMVQFDDVQTSSPTERFRGEGWLVGPYLVARAANQPLVFSASILTGETRNQITLAGLGTDRFDSKRTIFTAGVEGQFVTASGLILIPSFDLAHVRDAQEAYTDSASNPVPEQTITVTEAAFGLGFEKGLRTTTGDMVLTGKISGIFASEDGGTTNEESFRGRVDLGADLAFSQTSSLRFGAYFDGIGAKDYRAWGADLIFQLKF